MSGFPSKFKLRTFSENEFNNKALLGFEDPDYPDNVYMVVKVLYGLYQAPRACQDKYVAEILKKFSFIDVRTASTPMDTEKPLLKDSDGDDVDVNLYKSMIRSLMYLTSSRPDIMFAVCTCAKFQVTPKVSHSHAVKRIFRYLKGQPNLGLWYPRNSPFDLVAYSDSDYDGASLDMKSTTGGCQFLGCRLISWQCKKQTVANTLDSESNAGLWLIQVIKIHTDHNFADLLTKALDVGRFQYLVAREANNVNMLSKIDGRTCNIKQKYVMNQTARQLKRGRDTKIPQSSGPPEKVDDEAIHKELGNRIERATTTASSLKAEQDSAVWQTATASTLKDGDIGITATIDEKFKVVSEASIRRHLKLEDSDGSTIPVESHHTPTSAPSTLQPPTSSPSMPTTHVAEEAAPMPHDSPLLMVYLLRSDEGSLTLNELKVKKLEHNVKSIKARRKVRLVISDDEDDLEDPSKQGRKIAQIDEDEGITLTGVYDYPEGFTGPSISITTAEPVTTAGEGVSTARAIPEEVSTAEPDMDVTLAEALVDLLKSGKKKSPKPKARGISFQDPEEVARREVISPPVLKICPTL
ncbi:hypothetical protein Tco_1167152 [Tanacetum coccineum]